MQRRRSALRGGADSLAEPRPLQRRCPSVRRRGLRIACLNKTTLATEALLEGEVEALPRKLIDKAKEGDISGCGPDREA